MAQSRQITVALATLAVAFVAVRLAEAAETMVPAPGRFGFDDMVTTGQSELGGEKVGVHVPGIVHLNVDRRPKGQGARMALTVLGKLVTVDLDRVHHADGTREGPIDVRVFGIPVYRNQAARDGVKPKEPSLSDSIPSLDSLPNVMPDLA